MRDLAQRLVVILSGMLVVTNCYLAHLADDAHPDASARDATCGNLEARPRDVEGICLPRRELLLPAGRTIRLEVASLDLRVQSPDRPPPDCHVTLEGRRIHLELVELEAVPGEDCPFRPQCGDRIAPFAVQYSHCDLPRLEAGAHFLSFGDSSWTVEVVTDPPETTRTCWGAAQTPAPRPPPVIGSDQVCVGFATCSAEGLIVYAQTTCPDAVCVSWTDDAGTSHARVEGLAPCDRSEQLYYARCFAADRLSRELAASDFDIPGASLPSGLLGPGLGPCVDLGD